MRAILARKKNKPRAWAVIAAGDAAAGSDVRPHYKPLVKLGKIML